MKKSDRGYLKIIKQQGEKIIEQEREINKNERYIEEVGRELRIFLQAIDSIATRNSYNNPTAQLGQIKEVTRKLLINEQSTPHKQPPYLS
ncbi:MAG: hypothetical protein LBL91_06120 [Lachnospiraceae bacterium]|jgi:hypothetical protein|nr:hypothetical protein [Lachnospiraceae bacterium]